MKIYFKNRVKFTRKKKCDVCKKIKPVAHECEDCYMEGFGKTTCEHEEGEKEERERILKLINKKVNELKKVKDNLPEIKQQELNESNQHMRLDSSLSMLNTIKILLVCDLKDKPKKNVLKSKLGWGRSYGY